MSEPAFAVVGHPNKGKSSIVATLAEDDSVAIAPEPGTTVRCRSFPMRVDGELLYTLVDTPGFQRARSVLAWLRGHATSAARRAGAVESFVREHRSSGRFPDECELLAPVVAGAGILYVVDGARPYGEEYEAEMEILRWTGQPSMALINPIGSEAHVQPWSAALAQYFRVVRVFNAHTAQFTKRLELLRAFGQMRESWREPLERAVASLEAERVRRRAAAARAIADTLVDMLGLTVGRRLERGADPEPMKSPLAAEYRQALRRREQVGRDRVESIYGHQGLRRQEAGFDLVDEDLFAERSWVLWGLTRRQMLTGGAAAGAALGGGIDAAVGGASFMLGAAVGAAVGGASAWAAYRRVADVRVLGLPLGGRELRIGPVRGGALGFVILGRAVYHHGLVADRCHAARDQLAVVHDDDRAVAALIAERRRDLVRCFGRIRGSVADGADSGRVRADLAARIEQMLAAAGGPADA